jgi:hypothetical protein
VTEDLICNSYVYNTTKISSFQVLSGTSLAELQVRRHMMMSETSGKLTLLLMAQHFCRSLQLPGTEGKGYQQQKCSSCIRQLETSPKTRKTIWQLSSVYTIARGNGKESSSW